MEYLYVRLGKVIHTNPTGRRLAAGHTISCCASGPTNKQSNTEILKMPCDILMLG